MFSLTTRTAFRILLGLGFLLGGGYVAAWIIVGIPNMQFDIRLILGVPLVLTSLSVFGGLAIAGLLDVREAIGEFRREFLNVRQEGALPPARARVRVRTRTGSRSHSIGAHQRRRGGILDRISRRLTGSPNHDDPDASPADSLTARVGCEILSKDG